MRCKACDRILEDFEATRKYSGTQHYVDLCNKCYSHIKDALLVTERAHLLPNLSSDAIPSSSTFIPHLQSAHFLRSAS